MKIGMIFECGPSGADQQVCEEIVKKWVPTATLAPSVTLDKKPKLISECGKAAARLLGVDRKTLDRMIKRHNVSLPNVTRFPTRAA